MNAPKVDITLAGKILVFANLAFSLGLAGMALAIYTNRIDWPGIPPSPGEIDPKKAEAKQYTELATRALERWRTDSDILQVAERTRPELDKWFANQLVVLEGKDADGQAVQGQIKPLAYDQNAKLRVANERPLFGPPRQDLKSRENSRAELKQRQDDIVKEMKNIAEVVETEKTVTQEINGQEGTQKGLRDLLAEEEKARKNAQTERETLKPFRYNRQVEMELLAKRQAALSRRLTELKSVSTAAR